MAEPTPASRPRRGPHRSPEAHEAVLVATLELLAEIGFRKVTMERIAERAGVGKMTLYRWWPHKAAVVSEAIALRLAVPVVFDTGSVRTDALAFLEESVRTFTVLGDPSTVAGVFVESGEHGRTRMRDRLAERFEPAADLLRRGIERGELPDDLPIRAVVDGWVGFLLYRILFQEQCPGHRDLMDLVDLLPIIGPRA